MSGLIEMAKMAKPITRIMRVIARRLERAAPGPCELATRAELESLPAAQSHLALAQAALCMSRILDNRLLATTQPKRGKAVGVADVDDPEGGCGAAWTPCRDLQDVVAARRGMTHARWARTSLCALRGLRGRLV
jgi:hypothetical protein